MHCYLFVRCRTEGCIGKVYLAHEEVPGDDTVAFIDYPDEKFPVQAGCARCGQIHSYSGKEVQSETSHDPHHPPQWKPALHPLPPDTN